MFNQLEIMNFNKLIGFCLEARNEIFRKINSISSNECIVETRVSAKEIYIADYQNKHGNDETLNQLYVDLNKTKQTTQTHATQVARLKILEHSIRLITEQLQELGSPYKVKHKNEYQLLGFWDKTYTQNATCYTHKNNLQSIQIVNNMYNKDEYDFNKILAFVVEFKEQKNLDQILKPVNNIYNFMFYAFLGLSAALCVAIVLAAIYATPVAGLVSVIVLTLLAFTSLSVAEAYYDQLALFSGKYKPLSKTHSFLDVSPAVSNYKFDDLVTIEIRNILGQVENAAHDSNIVKVNALAEIDLEQIKNDYLNPRI